MTRPAISGLELCHYGMAQRWLVVSSQAALERAEASVNKACQRESEAIAKQLFHLQAQRFETPEAAQARWPRWRNRGAIIRWTAYEPDRTQTLCLQRPPDAHHPDQVH